MKTYRVTRRVFRTSTEVETQIVMANNEEEASDIAEECDEWEVEAGLFSDPTVFSEDVEELSDDGITEVEVEEEGGAE